MNHTITAAWTATLLACCLGTPPDATAQQTPPVRITCNTDGTSAPNGVEIVKELSYTQHTLGDTYPYKDTERRFQWDKIGEWLSALEAAQQDSVTWVTLQNYKDRNGIAPEVQDPEINEYRSATDRYGVSRYQSIPLYGSQTGKPARYSRDGALFLLLKDSADYVKVCSMLYDGAWYVPKDYVRTLPVHRFSKVIFVDRTDQNIATLEKVGTVWYVRSMNPATTGLHNPPYQQETPLGVYVIQEHKPKMYYLRDGSSEIAGFAPWPSRFTRGGYIHGVPLNNPKATEKNYIEFSPTLGTTPRSHMCVRNATSHAKYIYDWATPLESLVIVID